MASILLSRDTLDGLRNAPVPEPAPPPRAQLGTFEQEGDYAPNVLPWHTREPQYDPYSREALSSVPMPPGQSYYDTSASAGETLGRAGNAFNPFNPMGVFGTAYEGDNPIYQELARPANYLPIGEGAAALRVARGVAGGVLGRFAGDTAMEALPEDTSPFLRGAAGLGAGLLGGGAGIGAVDNAPRLIGAADRALNPANLRAASPEAFQFGRGNLDDAGNLRRAAVRPDDMVPRRTLIEPQGDINGALAGGAELPTQDELGALIARKRAEGLTAHDALRDVEVQDMVARLFSLDYNAVPGAPASASDITVNLRRAREADSRAADRFTADTAPNGSGNGSEPVSGLERSANPRFAAFNPLSVASIENAAWLTPDGEMLGVAGRPVRGGDHGSVLRSLDFEGWKSAPDEVLLEAYRKGWVRHADLGAYQVQALDDTTIPLIERAVRQEARQADTIYIDVGIGGEAPPQSYRIPTDDLRRNGFSLKRALGMEPNVPTSILERARAKANEPRLPDSETQQQAIRSMIETPPEVPAFPLEGGGAAGGAPFPGETGCSTPRSVTNTPTSGRATTNTPVPQGYDAAAYRVQQEAEQRARVSLENAAREASIVGQAVRGGETGIPHTTAGTPSSGRGTNKEFITEFKPETFGIGNGRQIVQQWQSGNRAILDRIGTDNELLSGINAALTGDLPDSFLTSALHRKAILRSALEADGLPREAAQEATDAAFRRELTARYGAKLPESVEQMLAKTYSGVGQSGDELSGLDTFIQRSKNTMFGLGDLGVFGIQALNALRRGNVQLFAGGVNRTLSALNLPHIATDLANSSLDRTTQLILDGVHQGIGSSGAMPEVGTMLSYLGKHGKAFDTRYVVPASNAMTRIQFQNVLGPIRNLAYEGDLVMLKALGRDIQNPAVRHEAAANANVLSSFAEQALNAGRRSLENKMFTSASMTRARVRSITQMAKLITPSATPEQRIMAATTIASTYGVYALFGKWLNDQIGTKDYEMDPSKLGFGLIRSRFKNAAGQNIMIDVVPQDSVERAFALSLRALADTNVDDAQVQRSWERVLLGSGSILARGGMAAAFRSGFDPGEGYKYGDISRSGAVQSVVPAPPLLQSLVRGASGPELGLGGIGVGAYPDDRPRELQAGDYQAFKGTAQFKAIPAETWRRMQQSEQYRSLAQWPTYKDWQQAQLEHYEQAFLDRGLSSEMAQVNAQNEILKNPVYKTHNATQNMIETAWIERDPEAAYRFWQQELKKPQSEYPWRPTKEQRALLDALVPRHAYGTAR